MYTGVGYTIHELQLSFAWGYVLGFDSRVWPDWQRTQSSNSRPQAPAPWPSSHSRRGRHGAQGKGSCCPYHPRGIRTWTLWDCTERDLDQTLGPSTALQYWRLLDKERNDKWGNDRWGKFMATSLKRQVLPCTSYYTWGHWNFHALFSRATLLHPETWNMWLCREKLSSVWRGWEALTDFSMALNTMLQIRVWSWSYPQTVWNTHAFLQKMQRIKKERDLSNTKPIK